MPDRVSQMAENRHPDQNDETAPDWEFVSLTASAYSAAPGPQNPHAPASEKTKLDTSDKTKLDRSEKTKLDSSSYGKRFEDFESPSSLFMSRHFLLHKEKELDASSKYELDGSSDGKMKGIDDELQKSLSHVVKMEERESAGMKGVDDELQKSLSSSLSGFEERESAGTEEERESDGNEEEEEEERESEERERESWWRKQIVSLYKRARERKSGFSMWKVLVTAALVGVAIVGQRWRREKVQFKQMKLHFLVNNERISCMVGPFDQYKRISNQNYASMLDYASLA